MSIQEQDQILNFTALVYIERMNTDVVISYAFSLCIHEDGAMEKCKPVQTDLFSPKFKCGEK